MKSIINKINESGKEERRKNIDNNLLSIMDNLRECNCMIYASDSACCISANEIQFLALIQVVVEEMINQGFDKEDIIKAIDQVGV